MGTKPRAALAGTSGSSSVRSWLEVSTTAGGLERRHARRQLEPVAIGQVHVDQRNLRPQLESPRQRRGAVIGLPDHPKALPLEQAPRTSRNPGWSSTTRTVIPISEILAPRLLRRYTDSRTPSDGITPLPRPLARENLSVMDSRLTLEAVEAMIAEQRRAANEGPGAAEPLGRGAHRNRDRRSAGRVLRRRAWLGGLQ